MFRSSLTAAVASFGHGANDVSNAVGPLSAIFGIWQNNEVSSRSEVPIWILAYGGAAISIGLFTYGYNMMRQLGNRLTLHSPSRGFSMELGAALTVVIATRLALPVSSMPEDAIFIVLIPWLDLNHSVYHRSNRWCW